MSIYIKWLYHFRGLQVRAIPSFLLNPHTSLLIPSHDQPPCPTTDHDGTPSPQIEYGHILHWRDDLWCNEVSMRDCRRWALVCAGRRRGGRRRRVLALLSMPHRIIFHLALAQQEEIEARLRDYYEQLAAGTWERDYAPVVSTWL